MATVLGSPLVQAGVVATFSAVALVVGRFIYIRAHERHEEIAERIANRKRPQLRSVLYEIFWLPLILLGGIGFVRLGVMPLPSTVVADGAMFVLDKLVIFVFVLVSINVIREVVRSAGSEEEAVTEEKEG